MYSYKCQYAIVFDCGYTFAYICDMGNPMLEILEQLMKIHRDTQTSLADKSGVPQATIQRFLKGTHESLSQDNVKKIAKSYGVTESQLRGDIEIDMIEIKERPILDISKSPLERVKFMKEINEMDDDEFQSTIALYRAAKAISEKNKKNK